MFSVKQGFIDKIDSYYISHPANCKLMKHKDNNSKNTSCSITLIELYERVDKWNNKYGILTENLGKDQQSLLRL